MHSTMMTIGTAASGARLSSPRSVSPEQPGRPAPSSKRRRKKCCTITDIWEAYSASIGIDRAANTIQVARQGYLALGAMNLTALPKVTRARAIAHRELRVKDGKSPCTINKEIDAIKRMVKWAILEGKVKKTQEIKRFLNLGQLRDRGVRKRRSFKLHEIHALLANLPEQWRLLFYVYLCTGMRRAEVLCLPWSEVDLEDAVIILPVERTKNRREHPVMLGPRVTAMLGALPRDTKYVFPNPDTGKPYCLVHPGRQMKKAAEAAGWDNMTGVSPQSLRRSFATIAYKESGKDEVLVGKLLGHKGSLAAECYIDIDDPDSRAAVVKVEAIMLGEGQ